MKHNKDPPPSLCYTSALDIRRDRNTSLESFFKPIESDIYTNDFPQENQITTHDPVIL